MPNCKVVRFNVGGTHYEVSQSLLDIYPSSFLAKLCSENWQQQKTKKNGIDDVDDKNSHDEEQQHDTAEKAKDDAIIFIDRNGERFQYILDYMRDTRVELPMSIPKGQFICDMEYYGLDYNESNIVLSVSDPSDLFHSLGRYRDFFHEKTIDIDQRLFAVAAEKLACDVAKEYFSQLIQERPADTENGKCKRSSPNSPSRSSILSSGSCSNGSSSSSSGSNKSSNNSGNGNPTIIQRGIKYFAPVEVKVLRPPGYGGRFQVGDIQSHLNAFGLKADWISYGNYYHGDDDEVAVKLQLM